MIDQNSDRWGIKRSDLSRPIRRFIKRKEEYLGRKCRALWSFTNPRGEHFLFGRFCINRDRLIVTVAAYVPTVGWVPSR